MTIGIAVACKDGIVVGADRKVTRSRGTRIKSLEDKIFKLSFRDGRNLLVCGSGGADLVGRAVNAIDPSDFDRDVNISVYRDMVERRISALRSRLSDTGLGYDATLLFGMIDTDNKPVIGHITPTALTEIKNQGYFTTGIAAPYAEIVLKDSYSPQMGTEDAKLIVGGLIQKIGEVDNDVEGLDVFCIAVKDKQVKELTWPERHSLTTDGAFSFNFKRELEQLKKNIKLWQKLWKDAEKVKKETTEQKDKGDR